MGIFAGTREAQVRVPVGQGERFDGGLMYLKDMSGMDRIDSCHHFTFWEENIDQIL